MWAFSLYTIVDGIFVAVWVGPSALASVNLAMPLINLVLGISLLFSTGAAAYISILMGKGEPQKGRQTYMTVFTTLVAVGISITFFTWLFLDQVVAFLGTPPNLHEFTRTYLMAVVFFAVFQILAYFFEVMSVADGFPKIATASILVAGAFNIGLDYLFIAVFGWGVKGAGIATGLAQIASVLFLLVHMYLSRNGRKLKFCKFRYNPIALYKSLPLGIADSITEFSVGIIVFLFNHRILQIIGESGLISYTVIAYINTLVLMTMFGLSQGMLPLVGYHHGKKEPEKVRELLRLALGTAVVFSFAWFAVCEIFTENIVSIFLNRIREPEIFSSTVADFRIYAIAFLFMGVNVVLATWFSAVERPSFGITLSIARALLVLAVMLYVIPAVFGPIGIWLSAGISETICLFLALCLYRLHIKQRKAISNKTETKITHGTKNVEFGR